MKKYKCSANRLVEFFEGSRNNWKNKAMERHEFIRFLERKVRDLEKSRQHWKDIAKKNQNNMSSQKNDEHINEAVKTTHNEDNTSSKENGSHTNKEAKNQRNQANTPSQKNDEHIKEAVKTMHNEDNPSSKENGSHTNKARKNKQNQNNIPLKKHNYHTNRVVETTHRNTNEEFHVLENSQKIIYQNNPFFSIWKFILFFCTFFLYYQYIKFPYAFPNREEKNKYNQEPILINKTKLEKHKEKTYIQALETKIYNLERNRKKWKIKAKENKSLYQPVKKQLIQAPKGHTYPTQIIQCSLEMLVDAHTSLRGINKTLTLVKKRLLSNQNPMLKYKTPAYTSICNWSYRMGLYLLNLPIKHLLDWILIIDHSGQSGKEKASVILGIPLSKLKETGYSPSHADMQVIDIKVFTNSTGETIKETLEEIAAKIGNIVQIVTDHGSDIKKGVELFVKAHPNTVATYDVSHYVATLLKKELGKDERWLAFLSECSKARKQVLQTELSFIKPPKQRTKARFMHTEEHLKWAEQKISYGKKGDFSEIDPNFSLDFQVRYVIENQFGKDSGQMTSPIHGRFFKGRDKFYEALIEQLGQSKVDELDETAFEKASHGWLRWNEKFGWLAKYEDDIKLYNEIVKRTKLTQTYLKKNGLFKGAKTEINKRFAQLSSTKSRVQQVEKAILKYVENEEKNIPENKTMLASSDIIESTFGKYKELTKNSPIKEVGKRLLLIPVFLTKLNANLVNKAMEKVRNSDVDKWAKESYGKSMLSKCRQIFKNITPKIT